MNKNPLVSVIIPLYNCEDRIIRCVNSVLNQTYKNIEVIVIDDGSTDNSLEVIRNGISDPRLKIYTQENHGVSYTRNRGIDIALSNDTEGWIAFVDSDDYIEPNAFYYSLISGVESYDLIHYSFRRLDNGGGYDYSDNSEKTIDSKEAFYLFMSGLISMKTVSCNWLVLVHCGLYRKGLIAENNIRFNREISNGEDALFNIQYLTVCSKILMINKPFYNYCERECSLSNLSKKTTYTYIEGIQFVWPAMIKQVKKLNNFTVNQIFASWVISYYNIFLNKSANLNLNYKEVRQLLGIILLQKEILEFVYRQKLHTLHEKIARLMLKSRSAFVSYVGIKAIRFVNGYWRVE